MPRLTIEHANIKDISSVIGRFTTKLPTQLNIVQISKQINVPLMFNIRFDKNCLLFKLNRMRGTITTKWSILI